MKRLLASVVLCLMAGILTGQTVNAVQILIPKNACTGDRCELKYAFHSDADLFSDNITGQVTPSLELATDWPAFNKFSDKCLIQKAFLEHVGYEYTLTLSFIPWHAGVIDFSAFDLGALVRYTLNRSNPSAGAIFVIDPDPVTIHSIAEKMSIDSLRPSKGPLVAPGTTFILILLALLFLAVCAAVIYLIIRIPFILARYAGSRELRQIKKLNKKTEKLLKKLKKAKIEDIEFCRSLVEVMRNYLCQRFSPDFAVITTGRFFARFEELACQNLSSFQEEAAVNITEIFQRCDYIRFASGSADSRRQPASLYETVLAEGERELLVSRCIDSIVKLNMEEEE